MRDKLRTRGKFVGPVPESLFALLPVSDPISFCGCASVVRFPVSLGLHHPEEPLADAP